MNFGYDSNIQPHTASSIYLVSTMTRGNPITIPNVKANPYINLRRKTHFVNPAALHLVPRDARLYLKLFFIISIYPSRQLL